MNKRTRNVMALVAVPLLLFLDRDEPADDSGRADASAAGPFAAGTPRPDGPSFADGVAAFEDGRSDEALEIFRTLAETGHANAQLNVGMLTRGEDPDAAAGWFERAARGGDPNAAFELAACHLNREISSADQRTGLAWLVLAAEGGSLPARDTLAEIEREFPPSQVEDARRLARELEERQGPSTDRRAGSGRAGSTRSANRGEPGGGSRPGDVLELETVVLRDPGNDNIESHRVLVPKGWRTEGGVTWTPEVIFACVHLDAAISGPDGSEVRFLPDGAFSYFASSSSFGVPTTPQIGQVDNGRVWMPPPQSPADFVVQSMIPFARPRARDVRLLSARDLEEVADVWRRNFAQVFEGEAQMNQSARQMGLDSAMQTKISAPLVRVSYEEDGREFVEEFAFIFMMTHTYFDMGAGASSSWYWSVSNARSVRATADDFDRRTPLLNTIATSVRPTERWKAMLDELTRQLIKINAANHAVAMREIRRRSRAIFEMGEEVRAMNRDSWERYQDSSSRLNRAFCNVIKGVDDYRTSEGDVWSLDSTYDRVFSNGLGEFVFTNDLMFDPNQHSSQTWEPVQRVTPMGAAASY